MSNYNRCLHAAHRGWPGLSRSRAKTLKFAARSRPKTDLFFLVVLSQHVRYIGKPNCHVTSSVLPTIHIRGDQNAISPIKSAPARPSWEGSLPLAQFETIGRTYYI